MEGAIGKTFQSFVVSACSWCSAKPPWSRAVGPRDMH